MIRRAASPVHIDAEPPPNDSILPEAIETQLEGRECVAASHRNVRSFSTPLLCYAGVQLEVFVNRLLILTGMGLAVAALLVAALVISRGAEPARVVFVAGESEYGASETLPALAASMRDAFGIEATVLVAPDTDGLGGPLPNLDPLADADLVVLFVRFREDGPQREALDAYIASGRPIIGLRTTSHAFLDDKDWFPPIFGGHYTSHAPNEDGTTALVLPGALEHPITRGLPGAIDMGHGGTYNAQPLADGATALLIGKTGDLPAEPIAWVHQTPAGGRAFYTSLGSREHAEREAFQTLLHNAVLWALGEEVPPGGALGAGPPSTLAAASRAVPAPPPLRAPSDATVLFDGDDLDAWRHWDPGVEPRAIEIDERADTSGAGPTYDDARWRLRRGAMRPEIGKGDVMTRESYGSYMLHLDFMLPSEPDYVTPPFRGNSGVFVQGRYEIQIADSHGRELDAFSCGAINGVAAPLVDAARPAGEWQSLEIAYEELPGEPARISTWLNGTLVQDEIEVDAPTIYGALETPARGEALFVAAQDIRFDDNVTVLARFRADGDGTIFSRAPAEGPWAADAKAVFLRGGSLVYDIGWVGARDAGSGFDDGAWHTLGFVTQDGTVRLYVDGELRLEDDGFFAEDAEGHVFKIGAASPNFAGTLEGEVDRVIVHQRALPESEIEAFARGAELGAEADLDWSAERRGAGPRLREDTESGAVGPIRLQADSSRVRFANVWLRPLPDVDHAMHVSAVTPESIDRGRRIYERVCMSCHGSRGQAGTLPTSRRFHDQVLEAGADPYAMYRTISRGYKQMLPQSWMNAQQKYDVIHYVREGILKLDNPSQYFEVTDDYIAALPKGKSRIVREPEGGGPDETYRHMDFGPSLNWTLQVEPGNIAYKGIAVRLDEGPGGVSKGTSWVLYDHDTMRVAAMWQGDFVDWRGIAFDGSHGTHTAIAGDSVFVNPVGPGWARPGTDDFTDPRLRGRDDLPYGPLPRDWAQYRGLYKHGNAVVLDYTVGGTPVLETPQVGGDGVLVRNMDVGSATESLTLRIAPEGASVALTGGAGAVLDVRGGFHVLDIAAGTGPQTFRVFVSDIPQGMLAERIGAAPPPPAIGTLLAGGPDRWPEALAVQGELDVAGAWPGAVEDGPYAVDSLAVPRINPWQAWMRLGGFDFYPGGDRAVVCTWNGDVWTVSGIDDTLDLLVWKRIAAGLFQPLGVKIVDDVIYVTCRDQIVRLHDLNGDQVIDRFECFNNDHQVTEHFHEFAMGLETDADGNFYYAKSARHAKTALVPHHGTLLRVSRDGSSTAIVANGFRAANGVCVNDDGTFFVTDQEGHWTPKNRINWVKLGGYYGNYMGYHDRGPEDEAMEQPLVWLTNEFDRSPAELLWVESDRWGPVEDSLLAVSYGMGQVFVVPHERVGTGEGQQMQGGQVPLPIPTFPTGVMRGRFSDRDGQLYVCGLFAWAGNRVAPGGFYRVRYTGAEVAVPVDLHAHARGLDVTFSEPLDRAFVEDEARYAIRVWNLKRTANYGSGHHDERALDVASASLLADGRTVRLAIPDLAPTWGMKCDYTVRTARGREVTSVFHNTVHQLPDP